MPKAALPLVGRDRRRSASRWRLRPWPAPRNHSRADRALAIVSCVVKVFDATVNSVVAGSQRPQRVGEVRAVDVRHEVHARTARACTAPAPRHHRRTEIRTADADVDDVGDAQAGVAEPRAAADRFGERAHVLERGATSGITSRPSTGIGRVERLRSATCRTARPSVLLIGSPANIRSRSASTPVLRASWTERGHRILRDQVLRVVDEQVLADRAGRTGRRVRDRSRTARANARAARTTPAAAAGTAPYLAAGLGGSSSHARKPPSNALSLWPRRKRARQLVEEADVAAAEHDVFGGHGGAQQLGALEHGGAPAFFAERRQAALAEQILERLIRDTAGARARARRCGRRRPARCRDRSRGRGTACGRLRRCRAPASPRR